MEKTIAKQSVDTDMFKNPYVIFYNGIGDHFLVLPTIRALGHIFENRLSLICHEKGYAQDIFHEVPLKKVIKTYFYEERGKRRFDVDTVIPHLKDCDLLISLNPWGGELDILDLLRELQLKSSVGFYDCFSIKVPFYFKKHNTELNFDIALALDNNLKIENFCNPPMVGEGFQRLRNRLKKWVHKDIKILALHMDTEPEKMWKEKNYIQVLEEIVKIYPDIYIVVVGQRPFNANGSFIRSKILQFSDSPLPFKLACAFVSISDFFLGIDSVFLHVADFYRIPSVGLFGPTSPVEFGFKYSRHKHVCSKSNIMADISVSEVVDAMTLIIKNSERH